MIKCRIVEINYRLIITEVKKVLILVFKDMEMNKKVLKIKITKFTRRIPFKILLKIEIVYVMML